MTYTSLQDIERAITAAMALRLLDDDHDGIADASVVADLLADVDAEIDGFLGRVYNLALLKAAVPPTVRRIATDLAVQAAYLRRPELLMERGETPWERRYGLSMGRLKDLRDGKIRIDIDGAPEVPANVEGGVYYGPDDEHPDGIGCGFLARGFGDF
jgi:phage gp36-like protein